MQLFSAILAAIFVAFATLQHATAQVQDNFNEEAERELEVIGDSLVNEDPVPFNQFSQDMGPEWVIRACYLDGSNSQDYMSGFNLWDRLEEQFRPDSQIRLSFLLNDQPANIPDIVIPSNSGISELLLPSLFVKDETREDNDYQVGDTVGLYLRANWPDYSNVSFST